MKYRKLGTKRLMAWILSVAVAFSTVSVPVFAEDGSAAGTEVEETQANPAEPVASGKTEEAGGTFAEEAQPGDAGQQETNEEAADPELTSEEDKEEAAQPEAVPETAVQTVEGNQIAVQAAEGNYSGVVGMLSVKYDLRYIQDTISIGTNVVWHGDTKTLEFQNAEGEAVLDGAGYNYAVALWDGATILVNNKNSVIKGGNIANAEYLGGVYVDASSNWGTATIRTNTPETEPKLTIEMPTKARSSSSCWKGSMHLINVAVETKGNNINYGIVSGGLTIEKDASIILRSASFDANYPISGEIALGDEDELEIVGSEDPAGTTLEKVSYYDKYYRVENTGNRAFCLCVRNAGPHIKISRNNGKDNATYGSMKTFSYDVKIVNVENEDNRSVTLADGSAPPTAGLSYKEVLTDGKMTGLKIVTSGKTPAGTYKLKMTAGDGTAAEFEIAVDKKPLKLSWTADVLDYTGKQQYPTIKQSIIDQNPGLKFMYDVIHGGGSAIGTHTVRAILMRNGSYDNANNYRIQSGYEHTYEITKPNAKLTKDPEEISGLTYNGSAHTLVKPGATEEGTILYRLEWQDDSGEHIGEYSEELPKMTDAGDYTVRYYVKGDDTHTDSNPWSVTVTIAPAEVTLSGIKAKDKVYDGATAAELDISGLTLTDEYDNTISSDPEAWNLWGNFVNDAGDLDANAGVGKKVNIRLLATDPNFKVTAIEPVTASITPKPLIVKWKGSLTRTYTGQPQTVTAAAYEENSRDITLDSEQLVYTGNTATKVGTYTAEVTGLADANYMLKEGEKATCDWSIQYLNTDADITVTGEQGNDGWYRAASVTLQAPDGYELSVDGENSWSSAYPWNDQGTKEISYQLKNSQGEITDTRTVSLKLDSEAPTAAITVRDSYVLKALNTITFGHWFKDTAVFKIQAKDAVSGVDQVEYQVVPKEQSVSQEAWTAGTSSQVADSGAYVIYTRVTDQAGNVSIINSDGLVVYQDATALTASVEYVRNSGESKEIAVRGNGNVITKVEAENGSLPVGGYVVEGNIITMQGAYLETLMPGSYSYTVNYRPGSVSDAFVAGDEPSVTTFTVVVKRKTVDVEFTDISRTYDGRPVQNPMVTTESDGTQSFTYYDVQGNVISAPKNAGTYRVKLNITGTENCNAIEKEAEFTIGLAHPQLNAPDKTVTYTGEPAAYEATVTLEAQETYAGEVQYSYREQGGTDSYTPGLPVNAGVYEVKAAIPAMPNYTGAETTAVLTIEPRDIAGAEVTLGASLTYDGQEQTQEVVSVKLAGLDVTCTVSGNQAEDAGPYTMTLTGTGNYKGTVEKSFTIARKDIQDAVLTLSTVRFTYQAGVEQRPELTSVTEAGRKLELAKDYEATLPEFSENAGTYTILVTGTGNYQGEAKTEYVIDKAAIVPVISGVPETVTYGDADFQLTTTRPGNGTVTYTVDKPEILMTSQDGLVTVGNAGTAVITATVAESDNYLGSSATVTVEVKKSAAGEAAVTQEDWIYGSPAAPVPASATHGTEQVTYFYKLRDAEDDTYAEERPVHVGSYTVRAVFAETENYLEISAFDDFEIQKKELAFDTSAVQVLAKLFDYNTKAVTYGQVTVTGMLEGEDAGFTYDALSAVYENDAVGTGKQVTVTMENPALENADYALPEELTFTTTGAILTSDKSEQQLSVSTKEKEYRLVFGQNENLEITPKLMEKENLNTVEKLTKAVFAALKEKHSDAREMAIYELVLLVSTDQGETWQRATEADIPKAGLEIRLAYPKGTDADGYAFMAAHMFTSGAKAGQLEYPEVTKKADGLYLILTGLSPVAVSWNKIPPKSDNSHSSSSGASVTPANTGDNTRTGLPLAMLLCSICGIGAVLYRRRKYTES